MIGSHYPQILFPTDHHALPNGIAVWSQLEYDILQTLALRVRLMSPRQANRIWLPGFQSERDLRQCLDQLVTAGLLQQWVVNAHPPLQPQNPLAAWSPGAPEPDWNDVSRRARQRWAKPATPTDVFAASKQTANLFGGNTHGLPPVEHRDHDLLLSDAYVAYRKHWPAYSARWIGEDFLSKAGFQIKDPDAFLIADDGKPLRVVESAGRYTPKQVESFHDHCASLEVPYELW